jgi:DNA-nicking Smr family endonuclease
MMSASEVDLHGLRPEVALRRLAQELHAARIRGVTRVLVITGRGAGNPGQQPVLRRKVEAWLTGPEGRRAGARGFRVTSRGGALEIEVRNPAHP